MALGNNYSAEIKKALLSIKSLSIYRQLLQNEVLICLIDLLNYMDNDKVDICIFTELYNNFYYKLAGRGTLRALNEYIIEAILFDENTFTKQAEIHGYELMDDFIKLSASKDLYYLQTVSMLSSSLIKQYALDFCTAGSFEECIVKNLPVWDFEYKASDIIQAGTDADEDTNAGTVTVKGTDTDTDINTAQFSMLHSYTNYGSNFSPIIEKLLSSDDWSNCIQHIADFHNKWGCGIFARFKAFLWYHNGGPGYLKGIENPDPVKLSDLIGYENERSEVINNTLQFLKGHPANNMLLYGDRGTGKSSTIKAIINEYYQQGLRIIEIPKKHLMDFPEVIRTLEERKQKFIIFVDDLAFEDNEENYTALKAILEGGVESKPANILIFATSNRRHLIKEKFSDRAGLQSSNLDEEIHAADTIQEKLSLADRFGIKVTFSSPDKYKYLEIVEGIVEKRGLKVDREYLHREALKWELWYNGRSPRTARQFVDWLEGTL